MKADHTSAPLCHEQKVSWRYRLGFTIVGLVSLAWLGFRTLPKPSRMVYPCQRVAAANGLGFLAYLSSIIASTRLGRLLRGRLRWGRLALMLACLALLTVVQGEGLQPVVLRASPTLPAWTHSGAVSDVFAVTNVPAPTVSLDGGAIPAGVTPAEALHDRGVDALLDLMASHGTPFYRAAYQPQGIVGSDDVVVLKLSNQWNCSSGTGRGRSHTNIDLVKGVIYRIVQHPEGFTGAVIVTDNSQFNPAEFDCADENNAQDTRQSYRDVVDAFVSQGYAACIWPWTDVRGTLVDEYASGDNRSGYVLVRDGTPGIDQLSYPKFEVTCGSRTYRVSMRHGLWDGSRYDNDRLKMLNMPIIKQHSMAGATIAVKNYIGFLTTTDRVRRFGGASDVMHGFFWGYSTGSDYGLLGRQLALIRRADLNLVDAIWINPISNAGGATGAVRTDVLLASTDPFAVDYYSSIYVLLPHLVPGSKQARNADPRQRESSFRTLLMTNEDRARNKGVDDIINLDDRLTAEQELAQFNAFVADASAPSTVTLSLAAEPVAQAVQAGATAVYTVTAALHGGPAQPVTLALAGQPSETVVGFEPNPVLPPGASRLSIATTASTATGIYPLTVTGTADSVTDTVALTLTVQPPAGVTLSLAAEPVAQAVQAGATAVYTVTAALHGGPAQPVTLALAGPPSETVVGFEPNPVLPPGASRLSITTTASTATGIYPLTVTGTADSVTDTVALTLTVRPPDIELAFRAYLPLVVRGQ